ncbi:MAG: molybdopterin-binding protein [Eubacteriales bacterium]
MKKIKTTEAVGHVLCHDITQIIKDQTKDALFRKGHIVREEDIPVLLSLGKDHLFVWEKQEGMLHENEAAEILYAICRNEHMHPTPVKEGKIDIVADMNGLFKADVERLYAINSLGEMMIATRHTNTPVKKGDKLAGTRVIPLVIEKEKMDRARLVAGDRPLLQILPFGHKKASLIITGNEVYHGRIKDAFGPVICEKLAEYDVDILGQTHMHDDEKEITRLINEAVEQGADLVICTGGMSVDPDDTTPTAIKNTGAKLITYGAPVLPGAMFLLAYLQQGSKIIPVLGLPGCVMYAKRTIFDLVLPRIMADELLTKEDIAKLGHGGLCLNCRTCTYPNCGFGK